MFRFDWPAWKKLPAADRTALAQEFSHTLARWEQGSATPETPTAHPNQSALFSQLGHKGDLMLVHFRDSMEDLNRVELELAQTGIFPYLELVNSYLSVVELGLYESSEKFYTQLAEKGLEPGTPEWNVGLKEATARTFASMSSRIFPAIPPAKYLCFYPMDRKRGEQVNWYTENMADRRAMMHEHGMIGRRYADTVRQIITGSIVSTRSAPSTPPSASSSSPSAFPLPTLRNGLKAHSSLPRSPRNAAILSQHDYQTHRLPPRPLHRHRLRCRLSAHGPAVGVHSHPVRGHHALRGLSPRP
jgi:chlorite dismutase